MPRNLSLEVWYRKKLLRMVKAMSNNAKKEILGAWKQKSKGMDCHVANAPRNDSVQEPKSLRGTNAVSDVAIHKRFVYDSGFARTLADVLRSLKYNWKNEFSHLSDHVAREYARRADAGTTGHLKTLLKEVGFGVKFKQTQEIVNILQATIAENVSLIKSIQAYYFTQVETIIMQGIKNGRDLGYISNELQDRFGITERRAVIIARDQTNKATGALSRARTLETGLTQATWVHIGGKKTDRSTHEAMDGKEFDLREGLYDPAVKRKIMPGELINCNCSYDILIPDTGQEGGLPFYGSK